MFTFFAGILIGGAVWFGNRGNEQDRSVYDSSGADRIVALHTRQDIKLLVFLMGGVLLMLGLIADRLL